MKVPCMGCNRRSATCHAECHEYKAYKAQVGKINKARDADRNYYDAENARRNDCRKRREGFRPT